MKELSNKRLSLILCGILIAFGTQLNMTNTFSQSSFQRKIVVFRNISTIKEHKDNIIKKYNAIKVKDLSIVNGAVIQVPSEKVGLLSNDYEILRLDSDEIVNILGKAKPTPTPTPIPQPTQVLPWGIDCVDAEKVFSNITADTIKIGIIDTGIDTLHPDLKDNIKGGINTINPANSFSDDHGHGTHVAGIIAASNNQIGVVGVAPKADIYAIKALDSQGNGYISDIIEGLDWAIKNNISIVNMSFGINSDVQSLHDAVISAYQSGIVLVAASGNDQSTSTAYPAAYQEVISVSAIDSNNNIAAFSSVGKVDLCAPGVNIYSAYKGATYNTFSGTSMAVPHVTGAVAVLLSMPSKCDLDGNGICTPDEVRFRLESTAIDLGQIGKDNVFGAGLVNVFRAIS